MQTSTYVVSALFVLGLWQPAFASGSEVCTLDTVLLSEELSWCPCYDQFLCAKLQVPLDYQNTELGRAAVPLVKYAAHANSTFGEYQGMVLLNPGGPGHSGVQMALEYAPMLQAVIGSNFDIVGFDPRGIYHSEPAANCSITNWLAHNSTLSSRYTPRMSDDYYNSWINYGKELGAECAEQSGTELGAGPHMSTATTARDMLSIVDAFAATVEGQAAGRPAGLLNYYGVSYGTFLGETFASMFPNRVGNVVLDGVVSPEGYLSNYTWSSVTHLDGAISAFFIQCYQSGPLGCSFYTGSSAKDIHRRFDQVFSQLDVQIAIANSWSNSSEIDSALLLLKIALLAAANQPLENFALLPDVLVSLENATAAENVGPWIERAEQLYGDPSVRGSNEYQYNTGILCSDMENRWYNKSLEDLRPLLADLNEKSIIGDIWIKEMLGCIGWSTKATETFQGPFGGNTKTPILFVGNTYDPVTSYDNVLSSAPNYNNSQVLIIDGLGHTTIATQNMCAYGKIAMYFQQGLLPEDDNFCPFESATLGLTLNGTLTQTIVQAGLSSLVN
ncbi:hypothetical protein S7711_07169 [Stachybotrys chartarum IBT 7711]|uniref:Peptidase S33 tripeptidyl aminopeptidase-like C-terminal domain-containing protein n=1 Tax=Stachybotrys chartarum (strain CBS 109288 / IBT 7711) TaxID=1280523 RepID=A0A084BAI8_STACB|nr:hypothetical protein S7711_07169 [Stachybotrys chartarum IBT 7711]